MGWRGAALGVLVATTFVLASSLGGTAAGASTNPTRVVDGCPIMTGTLPSGEPCDLRGAHLVNVDLSAAQLVRANLAGADLAGADLAEANLAGANLAGADLAGADLSGASLSGVTLAGADLAGAVADNVTLDDVTWNNTICPDYSDSVADGGSCNVASTLAASASASSGPSPNKTTLDGSTMSLPYSAGQSASLNRSAVGGGGALAFTGFPSGRIALIGAALVALGLFLLFLPVPKKRQTRRAREGPTVRNLSEP